LEVKTSGIALETGDDMQMAVKDILPCGCAICQIQINTLATQAGSPQSPGHPPADDEHPRARGFRDTIDARCVFVGDDE
jgi:hypothetical protein